MHKGGHIYRAHLGDLIERTKGIILLLPMIPDELTCNSSLFSENLVIRLYHIISTSYYN